MDTIQWSAPEFRFYEKTSRWYLVSLIVAIILGALALWQGNILFLIFVIIAEALIFFWGKQLPRLIQYELNDQGILADGKKLHLFTDLEAFALVEDDQPFELVLKSKRKFATHIKIFVPPEQGQAVKDELLQFLPEFDYQEPLAEHLMKRIRF